MTRKTQNMIIDLHDQRKNLQKCFKLEAIQTVRNFDSEKRFAHYSMQILILKDFNNHYTIPCILQIFCTLPHSVHILNHYSFPFYHRCVFCLTLCIFLSGRNVLFSFIIQEELFYFQLSFWKIFFFYNFHYHFRRIFLFSSIIQEVFLFIFIYHS